MLSGENGVVRRSCHDDKSEESEEDVSETWNRNREHVSANKDKWNANSFWRRAQASSQFILLVELRKEKMRQKAIELELQERKLAIEEEEKKSEREEKRKRLALEKQDRQNTNQLIVSVVNLLHTQSQVPSQALSLLQSSSNSNSQPNSQSNSQSNSQP